MRFSAELPSGKISVSFEYSVCDCNIDRVVVKRLN